jgi:sortase (surface protein transpeptidase)
VELALLGKGVGAAVIVQKLSVQAGAAYTVAAIGTKSTGFSLQVFVDDNRMVSGMATVRVYDLSPQSGALSVAAGTNTLIGPVSYRQASTYQSVAAGQYTFTFSSSQPTLTLVDQVTLKTDTVTSLFVVGVLHGTPPLMVIHVQVKGLPRLLAGTGSDPNALPVNASELAPAPLIALPLGVLALAGIAVAWFTRSWPFSRQKGSSRLRPHKLFGAALGGILALILSLGGLSFASFMTHPAPAPTARLLIPAIGVNAPIESVGVQANGAMDTARQSPWSDVGLYTGGPRPGDRGSAVIAGHLDRPGGNPAVFWRLHELHVDDEVQFVNAQGKTLLFHVTRIEMYPVQDAPVQVIFGNTTGRFLNLTTCTGDWIPTQHQRAMRLVVYTSFGPAPAKTSTVTSSAPLTLPSSSSHAASSTTAPSSSSSSVSSAPTLTSLPVAMTSTPVVGPVVQQTTSQVTSTPVVAPVVH